MILTCPACHKRYLVDVRSLVTERIVRCAACNHTWRQTAIKEKSALDAESKALNGHTPLEDTLQDQSKGLRRFSLGWLIYGLTWGLVLLLFIIAREPLIISFPPLYTIYKNLGLKATPPGYGFSIEHLSVLKKTVGNKPFLTLQGQVINHSKQVKLLTPLHVVYTPPKNCQQTLNLANNNVLKEKIGSCKAVHWSFMPVQDRLLPGEKTSFETTLPMPPSDFQGVIHF